MSARRKARKRALDILYESEMRGLSVGATLVDRLTSEQPPVNDYTVALVEGVAKHLPELDARLSAAAVGWTLERMPPVDRNLLRLGAFELLYSDDVADPVAIGEAVALAGELSTEKSAAFVNGVLAALLDAKPDVPAPATEAPAPRETSDVSPCAAHPS